MNDDVIRASRRRRRQAAVFTEDADRSGCWRERAIRLDSNRAGTAVHVPVQYMRFRSFVIGADGGRAGVCLIDSDDCRRARELQYLVRVPGITYYPYALLYAVGMHVLSVRTVRVRHRSDLFFLSCVFRPCFFFPKKYEVTTP